MSLSLILLCSFVVLSFCYDFTLSGTENKLLTWADSNGIEQNLLLSQLSVEQRTLLTQKATLLYEYEIDDNCHLTESSSNAIVYEPSSRKIIHLQYMYMEGNQIVSKTTIELLTDTIIKISDEYTINLSISQNRQTETSPPPSSLFLYDNETLLQINSSLYSSQPTCYMLSKMTEEICTEKSCNTLSPSQIYDMEIGKNIKNFSLANGMIVLNEDSTDLLANSVLFGQLISTKSASEQLNSSVQVKQQTVSFQGTVKLIVNFNASQSDQSTSTDLRKVSSTDQSTLYDVTITITNSETLYTLKTVNLYKGQQKVLSDRVFFKPLQSLRYKTQWDSGLQSEIPSVQIFKENLQLEGKYSLNMDLSKQTTEQEISLAKNMEINGVPMVEKVTVDETHSNKLAMIIGTSCGGGTFIFLVLIAWLCRKRIIQRCLNKQQEEKKDDQKVKNQAQCDKKQSGRELNIQYEITFDQKPSIVAQIPTSSTLQSNQTQIQNPQKQSNKHDCSFEKDLPIFSQKGSTILTEHLGERQNSIISEQVDRIQKPSKSEISLSLSSNCEQSYTRKRITRKRITTKQQKDQEQTETI